MIFPRLALLILVNVLAVRSSTDGCIDSDVDLRTKKENFVRTIEDQCRRLRSSTFFCRNIRLLVSITSEPFWCTQRQFDNGLDDRGESYGHRRTKRTADEDRYEGAGDGSLDNLVEHLNWDIFQVNKIKERRENAKIVNAAGLTTNDVNDGNKPAPVAVRNRTYIVYPVSTSFREELYNSSDNSTTVPDPTGRVNATEPPKTRNQVNTTSSVTSWPGKIKMINNVRPALHDPPLRNQVNTTNSVTSWPGNIKKINNVRPPAYHDPPLRNSGAPSVVHGYQAIQNLFLGLRLFFQQWNVFKSWISPGVLVKSARQVAEWMGLMTSVEGGRMSKRKKKKKAAEIMKVVMGMKMMKIVAISFLTAKLLALKAMGAATAALTLALSITFKKLPGGMGGGGDKKAAKTVVVSGSKGGGGGGGGWPEGWSGAEEIWDSGGGSSGGGGGWDGGGVSATKGVVMDGGWKADKRRKGMESRWRKTTTTEEPYVDDYDHR